MLNSVTYQSYAQVYDLAGQGRYGELMARWSLAWLAQRGDSPQRVLDLACGTGAASLVFASAGCVVSGVDAALPMLEIARAKARDARLSATFICADMRYLAADNRQHDAVTCFTDGINYASSEGDLERVFDGAAAALRPGGWLIF
ncbi:MAG: class I SAM-dependent methyltransferase, partial [Chloroflexales bacterium]|nr:class I SAM-dependent methyltransferase [Chloroflexales bacterium]